MKKNFRRLSGVACIVLAMVQAAQSGLAFTAQSSGLFHEEKEAVLALGRLTTAPAYEYDESFPHSTTLKALFFDALPYEGRPTKVFAYLGFPAGVSEPAPAVVLVHGGGGTAYKDWVKLWKARGFVAISIAVEGQIDRSDPGGISGKWEKHEWAGPRRIGIYGDLDKPLEDQWMYHAVADTILANSLLRSLPEVDTNRVGVVGISWGGVITSTAIGIDSRFRFANPIYGCGHMYSAANKWGDALHDSAFYRQVWDPMVRMGRVTIPTLWLSWPEDQHFPMDCLSATYLASSGPHMVSLIPGMQHSHPDGWAPPDSYAFAEAVAKTGEPWCRQTSMQVDGGVLSVEFETAKNLDNAKLISTVDTGFTGDRTWVESDADLVEQPDGTWSASATLHEETTAALLNVYSGALTVSSDYWNEN